MKNTTSRAAALSIKNFSIRINKQFFLPLVFFLFSTFLFAQNPIVAENALPGNPKSEWDIAGSDDISIQGFATQISVDAGQTVDFKIDVKNAPTNYSIKIYRLGYYNGLGARLIANLGTFSGVAQPQPLYDAVTGKTDCSNWSVSTSWNTGTSTSGLYVAKLTRNDTQGSSHIAFVVRNDNGGAEMLFKTDDTTWQAYNNYGGSSLYVDNNGIAGFNHATKVSYNRPINTRAGGGGGGAAEDWLFNSTYPMIRFLEKNGYDVSYTTCVDMDKDPKQITPNGAGNTYAHKLLLSAGHDEYWSASERTKYENARNAGVHLAFFTGNEIYWKVRWEDNHRTLVCYKEGTAGEGTCGTKCDPNGTTWTGTWRDGCAFPLADGCNPENALSGQISWGEGTGSIEVPSDYKNLRFWRSTNVALLADGNSVTMPYGTLGYEFDFEQFADTNPSGRITMSSTVLAGKNHKLSLYKHASGAWVFGAGTIQWSWGLDAVHDRGNTAPSLDMQQATVNLFTDMNVLPATLQSDLLITNPVNTAAPVSVVTMPIDGASVPSNATVIISGTASDNDGVVAGVEVSTDGGTTWKIATGTTSWNYSFTLQVQGSVTIKHRAFDDNGNMEIPGAGITLNVGPSSPIVCPCSIFPENSVPQNLSNTDTQPIEVGMKFKSAVNGFITGVRFYKAPGDMGTHIGNLWNSVGDLLASVSFNGESSDGWQQAYFTAPVSVNANTTYVISYHSSDSFYAATSGGLINAVTTGNLTALADGTDGANGVYVYSQNSAFPTDSYQSSNYWVDVVFDTTATDITAPEIVEVVPVNAAALVNISTAVKATFSESINQSSLLNKFELRDNSNALIAGTVSYNNATKSATLVPNSPLNYAATYTAKVLGGVQDLAGNATVADYSWTFNTMSEPQPVVVPSADGAGGPILIISSTANPFSRYPIEILRAEGINQFKTMDISVVNATVLANYEVAIVGEMNVNASQVLMLSTWINSGKTLIAMKPDATLFPLLGIDSKSGTLSDKYLLFNTAQGPGVGLVDQTIQFHSAADLYTLSATDAPTVLATLYSDASTATTSPAVISRNVGTGKVFAFAYDLSKSVIYTRQGNPAWAGQQRDDQNDGNIRSNDMFTGTGGQADWIDFNKVQIPQADEQQRLLSNIITQSILPKMPLPKFWFLPRKLKAAVVMTGDDHGSNGTTGRFDQYLTFGNNTPEDVLDWRAVRGTAYIYESTPLTNAAAAAYEAQGFEIGLHLNSGCNVYTFAGLQNSFSTQFSGFNGKYTSLSAARTHRTHCISWGDWASKPKVEVENGIRLNTDYYYWPASWVQDRPGLFTGSGMPMRFADLDGTLLEDYQLTTQMPDESGLSVANFINTLILNAKGPKGYYGVFCANMHLDTNDSGSQSVVGSNAIIASAIANEIPVISAKQMLTWLDGRNSSTYSNISFTNNTLAFDIAQASGARNLQGMVPMSSSNGQLLSLLRSGAPISFSTEVIKGINYAFFDAESGSYSASYGVDNTPPTITNVVATANADGTATIVWNTDEPATSAIEYGTAENDLSLNSTDATLKTSHSITVNGLSPATIYYFRITCADAIPNTASFPVSPTTMQFTTLAGPCVSNTTVADFGFGEYTNTMVVSVGGGGVGLKTVVKEDFSGALVPSGFGNFAWSGGTSVVSGGSLIVDGARFNTVAPTQTFAPGSAMEFVATFSAAPYQHIGFGGGGDATDNGGIFTGQNAWAMFGTGNQSSVLKVRTSLNGSSSVDVDLAGSLIGSAHLYKIAWEANQIKYYVDGALVHTETIAISETMRPAVSDFNNDGTPISVDWIQVSPYKPSGIYLSQIFNVGALKSWQEATWNELLPPGTTLAISQRQGNSAAATVANPWISVPTNGAIVGGISQYIQYKIELATTNLNATPVLFDIAFACSNPETSSPIITTQPLAQTTCLGSEVSFSSVATGNPDPTAQWQVSEGETNVWTDIPTAIASTYTFTPSAADNNNKFRVIWTNSEGAVTSNAVLLIVNPTITGTLSAVKNLVCPGEVIQLQLSDANGSGPYTIVVNGQTYSNVAVNVPFASVNPEVKSIWENTSAVGNNGNDTAALELGVKFQTSKSGYISGIKFYKYAGNTGTHTGSLWNTAGELMATLTFANETASGWQQATFSTPVFVQANTVYTASYYTTSGNYAVSGGYFNGNQESVNAPLKALSSTEVGANGVFQYGGGNAFPNNSFNNSNYWVDVLFTEAAADGIYNLTSIADNICTNTSSGTPLTTVTITTEPLPNGNLSATESNVCAGSPVNLVFNSTAGTGPFDLTINGISYANISNGIPFATTTATNEAMATTVWPDIIQNLNFYNDTSVVLGMKFTSTIAGSVSKIRIYQPDNGGTNYIATLWDVATQTALATSTYVSDTSAGWREITFATPVSIVANTNYMATFKAPSGYYTTSAPALSIPYSNGNIAVQSSHYSYGTTMVYPTNSSSANYLVDVVFTPTSSMNFNLTSITNALNCDNTVNINTTVTVGETTVWAIAGSDTDASWSNGLPNGAKSVVFNADYTINADFEACSIKVSNNAIVVVNPGFNVTLNGAIAVESGSSFTLSNTSNLLQNDSFAINSGDTKVIRNSNPLKLLDYTLWSSPVRNQNLFGYSPSTLSNRFYHFNTAGGTTGNGLYATVFPLQDQASYSFEPAKGYLIRMPNNHPTAPTVWQGKFTGTPNNGDISIPLAVVGNGYNAVGNPYPSKVDLSKFALDNAANIGSSFYYWRKTNNATKPSYCSFNTASFTYSDNGEANTETPVDISDSNKAYLPIGQGFIVQAKPDATSVIFRNSQRSLNTNDQFFRHGDDYTNLPSELESHRFWLNMTGNAEEFSQTVVGYFTNATQGLEQFDSKYFNDGPIALMSTIDSTDLVIQGRALPFELTDIVALKYKSTTAGNYTIAIDHTDGLFTTGAQAIYIKDNLTTLVHNLTDSPFTFTTTAGTFDDRFEIVYQDSTLGTNTLTDIANQVILYSLDGSFVINSGKVQMKNVKVFDLRGRLIAQRKDINAWETKIIVFGAKQLFIVEITTVDNEKVIKKAIN